MIQDSSGYGSSEVLLIKGQVNEGNLSDALESFNRISFEGNQRAIANDPDVINGLLGHLKDPNKIVAVKQWLERITPLLEGNVVMKGVAEKAKEIIERGDAAPDANATKFADLNDKVNNLNFGGKNDAQKEEALKEVLIAIVNVEKGKLQNSEAIKDMLAKIRGKLNEATPNEAMKDRFEGAVKIVEKTFDVRRKALGINVAAAEYDPDILRNVRAAGAGHADEYAIPHGIGGFPTVGADQLERRDSVASTGTVESQNNPLATQELRVRAAVPPTPVLDAQQGALDPRADRFAFPSAVVSSYNNGLVDELYALMPLRPGSQDSSVDELGAYSQGVVPTQEMQYQGARGEAAQPSSSDPGRRTDPLSSDAIYSFEESPGVAAAGGAGMRARRDTERSEYTSYEGEAAEYTSTMLAAADPRPAKDAVNVHGTTAGAVASDEKLKAQKKEGEVVKFFKSHEGARYTLGTLAVIAAFAAPPVAIALAAAMLINELSPVLKPVVGVVLSVVVGTFEMLGNGMKAIANLGIAIKNLFSAEKTPYYSMSMEGTKIVFNSFMSKSEGKTQAVPAQIPEPTKPIVPTETQQPAALTTPTAVRPTVVGSHVEGATYDVPEGSDRYAGTRMPGNARDAAITVAQGVVDAAQRPGTPPTTTADSTRYQPRNGDRSNLPAF